MSWTPQQIPPIILKFQDGSFQLRTVPGWPGVRPSTIIPLQSTTLLGAKAEAKALGHEVTEWMYGDGSEMGYAYPISECSPRKDYTIKDAMFVVEATSFEYRCLWERNKRLMLALWEEVLSGYMHQVGTLASDPVTVSVRFALLDGCLVAFYEAASQVVDHRMVKEWLQQESPAYASGQKCDADNFHNCLLAVAEKTKIDPPAVQG